MSTVTLNQLATRIINEQGNHLDDPAFVTQCETWLKAAMVEVDSEGNMKIFARNFTITTDPLVTDGLYDLPQDFRSIKYLRHINTDDEIDYTNPKTLVAYNVDLEQFGTPHKHWVTDPRIDINNDFIQRVKLWPVPNSSLTIDGQYYYDVLNVTSSDVLPLSPQAILCLESRLRMYITKAEKEWTAYNVERGEYAKNLAGLLRQETNKPSRKQIKRWSDITTRNRPARLRYPFE